MELDPYSTSRACIIHEACLQISKPFHQFYGISVFALSFETNAIFVERNSNYSVWVSRSATFQDNIESNIKKIAIPQCTIPK